MIYSKIRVIDGDTIEIKLWPSGLCETCRIEGLDCDEMDTKRGEKQRDILQNFSNSLAGPYIFLQKKPVERLNGWAQKRCGYGRAIAKVYVWRWYRYVNYAEWMKKNGNVKKGSKWNK